MEVDEAANHSRGMVDPDANIIVGSAFNPDLDGKMRVSVVATGIDARAVEEPQPQASRFGGFRSEEHTSELQSLMRISYAVFCLKKTDTAHTAEHNSKVMAEIVHYPVNSTTPGGSSETNH